MILQALSDHPLGFSELKRIANIESSGNLSFHLNKLGKLIKTTAEGDYSLTDEGREAIRVVEATKQLGHETRSRFGPRFGPGLSKGLLVILFLALVLGASMIAIGPSLASQTQLAYYGTTTSPTNFTIPSGGEKFWFGEGNSGYSPQNIEYFAVTSPPWIAAEFQITVMGAVNSTILSTQSNYLDTNYVIPAGTRLVNYTISNPTGSPLTIVVALARLSVVDYPYSWIGDYLLYLGIAMVVACVIGTGLWALRGRTPRPGSQ